MERNTLLLIILGIVGVLILLAVDMYLAIIAGIILGAIVMSLMIMEDTRDIPDIAAVLSEDAKAILLTNKGNAKAVKIHATLVPSDLSINIPVLEEESTYSFPLPAMVDEIKIVMHFENEAGKVYSRSSLLSALKEEPDLLKPMMPIFKWKK